MDTRSDRFKLLPPFLLIAATVVVYWQVGSHDFINYDDPEYVFENPFVRAGISFSGIAWAFTTFHSANWHPLTWLSHMADVSLFGLAPGSHHLVSVLLHTANALLLFFFLKRMTGCIWRSFSVASLFALHPLHVESVAWVAERKDVVSMFFCLITLYLYVISVQTARRRYYFLMILAFICGLMAKPMLVTLPLLLLLLDYWPLGRFRTEAAVPCLGKGHAVAGSERSFGHLFRGKISLLVLSGVSCFITLSAQHESGAVKSLMNYPLWLRAANAATAYSGYLYNTAWPRGLAVYYPFPQVIPAWRIAGSCALLAVITLKAVAARRSQPYILVGWFWYLATLIPVIGLVQVGGQASADRYTYLPLIGVFVAVVWWLGDHSARWRYRQYILPLLATLILAICAYATYRQTAFWRGSITLFSHALDVTDNNYVAHNNLGFELANAGKLVEAEGHFREAIRIAPHFADAYLNLGDVLLKTGNIDNAMPFIAKAIELRPDFAPAHNDLGVALLAKGRLEEALACFNRALEVAPELADGNYNKGVAMSLLGRSDEAIEWYGRAISINPGNPNYHGKMGVELARRNRLSEAAEHFTEVLRVIPDDVQTRRDLEQINRVMGK